MTPDHEPSPSRPGPPPSRRAPIPVVAVALALVANLVVLANVVRHPVFVGYDATAHLAYAQVLAEGRLPLLADTQEYFSAPLPYVPVALALAAGMPVGRAGKLGQATNLLASLVLTATLLMLCAMLRPGNGLFAALAVGLACFLPVYAKSFSQFRGEPWVAAAVLLLVLLLVRLARSRELTPGAAALIGVVAAAAVLSRQWGVLAVGGTALWVLLAAWRGGLPRLAVKRLALVSLPLLLVGGGWYYASLAFRTGNPAAFNLGPHPQSLAASLRSLALGTGNGALFTAPIRPAFPNQLLPILHSETWGDYWCYFLVAGHSEATDRPVYGRALEGVGASPADDVGSNREEIAPYLGRLNLLGLPVSLLLLAGGVFGVTALGRLALRGRARPDTLDWALLGAVAAVSLAGYLGFVTLFPVPGKGDTIKATYLLHVFPMLALLSSELLVRLRDRAPRAFTWVMVALVLIGVHAFPALFTRY